MLNFKPVTLEARPQIQPYLDEWAIEHSDSSFGSLYIWQEAYDIRYDIVNDALFVHVRDGDKPPMLKVPFTRKRGEGMAGALETAEAFFAERGANAVYSSVSDSQMEAMEAAFPGKYVFEKKRDFFDYVYFSGDLIMLSGGKYHAKRNHISAFRSANEYVYERYSPEAHKRECVEMYEQWLSGKDRTSPGLEQERLAVMKALQSSDELGFVGGVIRVFGKVEAFTFGERIGDMAIIHVEKANGDIRGLYPHINQQFVENEFYDVKWINREEDMGEPGLRKAKESYHPARMVEKMGAWLA